MKKQAGNLRKILFAGIVIGLLGIQGVAGLSVSVTGLTPSGDLSDGTPVTVTFDIARTGIRLYDQLVITTDLENPVWDPRVIVRDQETPVTPAAANGKTLTLNGALYNYPSAIAVKVRVTVNGTIPFNHTASQDLLRIRQLDADGTEYAYPSGFTLPMAGSGSPVATVPLTRPVTAVTTETAIDDIPGTPTEVREVSSRITTVPPPKKTLPVPTAWPTTTPAAAPGGPAVALGAIGIGLYLRR